MLLTRPKREFIEMERIVLSSVFRFCFCYRPDGVTVVLDFWSSFCTFFYVFGELKTFFFYMATDEKTTDIMRTRNWIPNNCGNKLKIQL